SLTLGLTVLACSYEKERVARAPQHLLRYAPQQPPADSRSPVGSHRNEGPLIGRRFIDDGVLCFASRDRALNSGPGKRFGYFSQIILTLAFNVARQGIEVCAFLDSGVRGRAREVNSLHEFDGNPKDPCQGPRIRQNILRRFRSIERD